MYLRLNALEIVINWEVACNSEKTLVEPNLITS